MAVRAILGDIYDAWRVQNLDWMATYLPDDFCHVIHIPVDLHPLGGTRQGKKEGRRSSACSSSCSSSTSWYSTRATC
jgi:hypothetical protein